MKSSILLGHERPITQIKYNREGDLLFSSAKDNHPCVWYSVNGERLGTYDGHQGVVWCIDVDWETKQLMSGAGDNTLRIWDVQTGKSLGKVQTKTSVKTCAFSYSGRQVVYSTDSQMGYQSEISVIDVRMIDSTSSNVNPQIKIPSSASKATSMLWGALDETIISGHENGDLELWDVRKKMKIKSVSGHGKAINDIQLCRDGIMLITASKDKTAKLFDSETLKCLKTYKTERPVNSAALSPIADHVVLGGGQEAMDVTSTSTRVGEFDARFYHMVFEEEFGRVKGHFGPINSLAFHPDGKAYASGSEDGYIRLQDFDQSYFDFKFDF